MQVRARSVGTAAGIDRVERGGGGDHTVDPSRRGLAATLLVYAGSRALVAGTTWAAAGIHGGDPGAGPWPPVPSGPWTIRALNRWDGAWYVDIARHGYGLLPRDAFFPLLPLLIRLGRDVTGLPWGLAGALLSVLVGGLAVVAVWRLVEAISGPATATRAACLLTLFPGSFALTLIYSEGLLILGAAGALYYLQRRAWLSAGVLGAIASASRPTGVVVVLACAWAAWRAREARAAMAPVVAAVGCGAYVVYCRLVGGAWGLWLRSEREAWHDRTDFGHRAVSRLWSVVVHGPHASFSEGGLNDLIGALGLAFLIVSLVCLWRWRPPAAVTIYAVGAIGMVVVSNLVGPRPRMLLAAFPLVAALGVAVRGRAYVALLSVSTLALIFMTATIATTRALTP